tara:strand:+ start:448 stop:618 length:171 start_codon:yes stop_codon:yes gene_type:complete
MSFNNEYRQEKMSSIRKEICRGDIYVMELLDEYAEAYMLEYRNEGAYQIPERYIFE